VPPRRTSSLLRWLEARFNLTEMFSMLTNVGLFPSELDNRKPLREAIDEALARPLPSYARWPRVLAILTLALLGFLVFTGFLLAFYYQPTPAEAWQSTTMIVRDVSFGWFVHQVHGWAADALLLILLVRLWRFYFQGLYRAPREGLWILAVFLFLAATHADLTGHLLSWTGHGYWTTVRAIEILYSLPVLGPLFAYLVGGVTVDSLVLTRFYFLHVAVWPPLLIALIYLTSSGVRRVGLSGAPESHEGGRAAYTHYLYNLLILVVVMLGVLVTLATLLPARFDQMADPFSTPPGARPPWYLLASYGFMEFFPGWIPRWTRGLLLEGILLVCLLVPFIDRGAPRPDGRRPLAVAIGVGVLVLWVAFTWYGYRLESGG
jgi:quinol-cytochrome oxidoreductase complex cytochrome b subunit